MEIVTTLVSLWTLPGLFCALRKNHTSGPTSWLQSHFWFPKLYAALVPAWNPLPLSVSSVSWWNCHFYSITVAVLEVREVRQRKAKVVCFLFFVFFFFRAAPEAYGSSQVRGQIGARVVSLHHSHSNAGSKLCLQLILQLRANAGSLMHWTRLGIKPHPHGY